MNVIVVPDIVAKAPRESTNDANIVVGFALTLDDHWDRHEFLEAWQDGRAEVDEEWSDWRAYRDNIESQRAELAA